jgi:hypothetical protein
VYFLAHFPGESKIYTIKTDGTGLAPLPEYSVSAGGRAVAMSLSGDSIWVIENNIYAAGVQPVSDVLYFVRELDKRGAEISRLDLSDTVEISEVSFFDDHIAVDKSGDVWVWDNVHLRIFDGGQEIFTYRSGDEFLVTNLVKTADETVFAVGWNREELAEAASKGNYAARRFVAPDYASGVLNTITRRSENSWFFTCGNDEFDYYYSSIDDAGAVNLYDEQPVILVDWDDYGLKSGVTAFTVLPEGEILCAARRDATQT